MQAFIERSNSLVTCSKDGYVRVWDLGTQHCYQILLGQQGEVSICTSLAHGSTLCRARLPMCLWQHSNLAHRVGLSTHGAGLMPAAWPVCASL